jgi:solute carrier family 50 (sugar transporter)
MVDPSTIILEYVCPAMGTILANLMFSAPYKDIQVAIQQRGQLGDLNPTPWAFMLGNCCGWVTYSFLRQNYWIFFANAPGFVLSVYLNMGAAKLQYQGHRAQEMRKSFATYLVQQQKQEEAESSTWTVSQGNGTSLEQILDTTTSTPTRPRVTPPKTKDAMTIAWEVTSQATPAPAPHESIVLGIVVVWVTCIAVVALVGPTVGMTAETRQWIVGILVNLNLVFFYGAPLSTIVTVLQTKNSSSIHLWTMMTNTGNGAFWTAYGLAVHDSFISIPNGLGTLLGIIQMMLCMTVPRTPRILESGGGGDGVGAPSALSGVGEVVYLLPTTMRTSTLGQLQMMEQTTDLDLVNPETTATFGSDTSPELLSCGDEEVELEPVGQQQQLNV